MKARKLPRRSYRRGDVLWIRFKNAKGTVSRESTGQGDVKVAEAILAKRRSEVAMLHHFPTRKFEQVSFDELRRRGSRRTSGRHRPSTTCCRGFATRSAG